MNTQNEIQRVKCICAREQIREGEMQHPLIRAELLDHPAGTPYIGLVRHAIRCFFREGIDFDAICFHCISHHVRVRFVVHDWKRASDHPANAIDFLCDHRALFTQECRVLRILRRDEQLGCSADA